VDRTSAPSYLKGGGNAGRFRFGRLGHARVWGPCESELAQGQGMDRWSTSVGQIEASFVRAVVRLASRVAQADTSMLPDSLSRVMDLDGR